MEQIPEDKFLKYNPDTLIALRKLYNLDKPGQMDEVIDLLDAWVKKQSHLVKKDYSRDYLERVIILLKGSVERAKSQIEKICTLRTLLPQFFEKIHAKNDYKLLKNCLSATLLPRLLEDHTRLFMLRLEPAQYISKDLLQIYFYNVLLGIKQFLTNFAHAIKSERRNNAQIRSDGPDGSGEIVSDCNHYIDGYHLIFALAHTLILEYMKAHDFSDGMISIVDLRSINSFMDFVPIINLTELKQQSTIMLQGYAARVKKIIMISTSSTIDMMIRILKQILSEKLGQRIYVVPNIEKLHELVPKAVLPSDYGGEEKPLAVLRDEFQDVLASKENIEYLKEMSRARTNESLRTSSKISEEFMGLAGTFRTLCVD